MTEFSAFFEGYFDAWRRNEAAAIENHWATDEPAPFYKAEEIDEVFSDWESLRAYWRHNEGFNERIELSGSDVKAQPCGADRFLCALKMRWDIEFSQNARTITGQPFSWAGQAMGGNNHVISMLKRDADALKLMAWIEAPNAPITYMAELYMRNTREGFDRS